MREKPRELTRLEELRDEAGKFQALDAMRQSEGGKVLLDGLRQDMVTAIDLLASEYRTLPEMELRVLCAQVRNRLDMGRVLTRAEGNKDFLNQEIAEELLK